MPTIAAVETWRCVLPLPRPVRLGRRVIPDREYQVLRLELDDGSVGAAVGYTRGLPLTELVGAVVPLYLGVDATDPAVATRTARAALSQTERTVIRAMSLLDIAMWDATARARRVPLWAMFGSEEPRPAFVAVCGYYPESRSNAEIAAELKAAVDRGHRAVKLICPPPERGSLADYLDAMRAAVPDHVSLSMDFYSRYTDFDAAEDDLRRLDDAGLEFIEDPFPPGSWRDYARASELLRTPLAAGEDAVDGREWGDLVELGGVGVLRVDATASGGITAVLDAAAGLPAETRVYPHVFAALHAQLAIVARVDTVEVISAESGTDPLALLGPGDIQVDPEGRAALPANVLGTGWEFDWAAVAHYAEGHERW